jgi:PadR family transcriptional regulator, regulatory protein AphA
LRCLFEGCGFLEVYGARSVTGPARKVYMITARGAAELREWALSAPELTQFRNTFLVQLAWADQLDGAELDGLLARYEREVETQVLILQERERRGVLNPARTPREAYLWREIAGYFTTAHANELAWVRALRQEVAKL